MADTEHASETNETLNPQGLVHLHVHSEYSLLDGAVRISDAIQKVKSQGHTALALTDHGNMYGAIEFYGKCKDAGIKPIIGAEVYWQGVPASEQVRAEFSSSETLTSAYHLVLLAKSKDGYHNLCRVVSAGFLKPLGQDVPVICREELAKNSGDLIALSSCLQGEFAQLLELLLHHTNDPIAALQNPPHDEAKLIVQALDEHVAYMKQHFGDDRYYLELIDNNLSRQRHILPYIVEAAAHYRLPIVASADAHYLNVDDAEAHAVLTSVKNDLTMSAIRQRNTQARFHLLTNEEMETIYGRWPEALANQRKIEEACQLELSFGTYFLPKFDLEGDEQIDDALRRFAKEGLEERLTYLRQLYGTELTEEREKEYWQRLEYETEVIISMGFPGYFLIVQDFINWAKDNGIPVGPGRGSGAGSLVAYALRITDLDPLRFNLIFERFLNPERVSMPDFDVDFCQDRRDEVIQYVTRKYGSDNVAMITTFGKMKAKAALRDVGRVLELGYTKVDRIAKLIPNELDIKLQSALDREPRIWEEARKDENVESMIRLALKIEGLSRHTSVHAAGVVISEGGMENYVPVYRSEDGVLITQYEMKNAEKVGLVKFDFLGLKTLTVINKAVQLIRATKDAKFDIDMIDLEKKAVYDMISSAHSVGIFQLESSGMQGLLRKLKPSRFEDIIAVVALYRPGPLGSGMVDDFIERKHGRQEITYPHPALETILDDTYGIILYQEQVQKIAASLASYSLGEADLLRRAMGKKKPEEMAKQKVRFSSGCKKNNVDETIADELFELMAKFAAYGFNKSHSSAYGLVSYQTAFLKTYYPAEFMAAIMTCDLDNTDKIVRYIEECRRMKFKIYPPDINRSQLEFDVPHEQAVGYGLAAIKGIGIGSLEPIIREREANGPYASLTDFAKRVNLARIGKKTLELLVQAGALDSFTTSRSALNAAIPEMVKFSDSHHNASSSGQQLLFADDEVGSEAVDLAQWEEKLRRNSETGTQLEWFLKERKMLGVFLSGHPVDLYQIDCQRFSSFKLKDAEQQLKKKNIPIVALLTGVSERLTKSNKKIAFVQLEDETASFEAIMAVKDPPEEYPPANTLVVAYVSVGMAFDGSGINLRVESLKPLEDVRREIVKKARISIKACRDKQNGDMASSLRLVQELKQLIAAHPGQTPFCLDLDFGDAKLAIEAKGGGIDLNDLFYQNVKGLSAYGVGLTY
ncbi:MAG: DNA polymerase III subunit alpha [Oligoflexus sp.]